MDGQGNPYKFAGYEHDSETGLYYLRARYYSPKSARFISEDSYRGDRTDPLSLNLYTYCHNEPIRYIDPSGHFYAENAMDESSYYNRIGLQSLQEQVQQAKTLEEKAEAARKLEYYEAAISAGDQVITNKAVRERIEYLEERAYGPSKSSAASTAKSSNEIKPNYEKILDTFQTALDFAEILPVIGTAADTINGIIYLARGNYAQGVASLISTVPGFGDLVGGAMKTFLRVGGDAVIASCMKEILSYGDDLARYGKQLNLKGLKDTIKKIEGGIKEAVAQLDNLAKEVAGAAKGTSSLAKVGDSGNITRNAITKNDLIREITGVTEESTNVAQAIKEGKVKVNLLGDELYNKYYYPNRIGHCEFASDGNVHVYLRRNSASLFEDTVHEGVHGIDMYNRFGYDSLLSTRTWEFRAYSAESAYQRATGGIVNYSSSKSIMDHITSNYDADALFDPYKTIRKR